MAALPSNWTLTSLGAICDLINGRAFKPTDWSNAGLPIIRIQNLRSPLAAFNRFDGEADERHKVADGDLLFAWSGTPGTSFRAHIWSGGPAILNQHIFKVVFDPGIARAEYLKIAINAHLPTLVKQAKGGAGLKHLTRSTVEAIPVALPPRTEQDRIVATLSETSDRLEEIDAELTLLRDAIPALERNVLAQVVSGNLLRDQPADHAFGTEGQVEARTVRIADAGELMIGRQRSPDVHSGPSMRPYLRVANVLDDRIDASDMMSMNFDDAEFHKYKLLPSDILLNEGQSLELVGRAAMYRGDPCDVAFTNTLIRFRAGPQVEPEYALLVFRGYQQLGRFREIARITTNLAHLGLRRLAELEFPLPPLTEQRAIAQAARALIRKLRECCDVLGGLSTDAQRLISLLESEALVGRLSEQSERESAPVIPPVERVRPKINGKGGGRQRNESKEQGHMSTIPLLDALKQSDRPLDGQALFSAAGYPDDAPVLQVEQFFLELRSAIVGGTICRSTDNGEEFSAAESRQ